MPAIVPTIATFAAKALITGAVAKNVFANKLREKSQHRRSQQRARRRQSRVLPHFLTRSPRRQSKGRSGK